MQEQEVSKMRNPDGTGMRRQLDSRLCGPRQFILYDMEADSYEIMPDAWNLTPRGCVNEGGRNPFGPWSSGAGCRVLWTRSL
jgi:hypothetical protein